MNIELPMPDVGQQKFGESLFAEVDAVKQLQTETIPAFDALLAAVLDRTFKAEL